MRYILCASLLLASMAGAAHAKLPRLNATCPTGIDVHADEGGPVYVNSQEARVTGSGSSFEARSGDIVIDIGINVDQSVDVFYTARGGANGVCQVQNSSAAGGDECPAGVSQADRYKYPACN